MEGDVFHLRVRDRGVTAHTRPADAAELILRTSAQTSSELASGDTSVPSALARGELLVDGSPEALEHALAIFGAAWGIDPSVVSRTSARHDPDRPGADDLTALDGQ